MTTRKRKGRSASSPNHTALARWDTEGGALEPVQRGSGDTRVPLSEQERRILHLGAAVLLRWNDLPTHIQRVHFEHTLVDVEAGKVTMLKEQIARSFIRTRTTTRAAVDPLRRPSGA